MHRGFLDGRGSCSCRGIRKGDAEDGRADLARIWRIWRGLGVDGWEHCVWLRGADGCELKLSYLGEEIASTCLFSQHQRRRGCTNTWISRP